MHIGRLSAKLTPGVFVVEDLVIEGLEPGHRPFLKAKKIEVVLPWWTIFTRKLIVESVEMTDWDMLVETWPSSPGFPNGRHNFPKFTRDSKSTGPKRFTTTLRSMLASRGSSPTRTTARRGARRRAICASRCRAAWRTPRISARASFSDRRSRSRSTSRSARACSRGSPSTARSSTSAGSISPAKGRSRCSPATSTSAAGPSRPTDLVEDRFPDAEEHLLPSRQRSSVSGKGDFHGTFHLFKGGRELKGTFSSPLAGRERVAVPRPARLGAVGAGSDGGDQRDERALRRHRASSTTGWRRSTSGTCPIGASWDVAYRDVDLAQLTDFLETQGLRLGGRATGRNHLDWPLGKWAEKRGEGEVTASAAGGRRRR